MGQDEKLINTRLDWKIEQGPGSGGENLLEFEWNEQVYTKFGIMWAKLMRLGEKIYGFSYFYVIVLKLNKFQIRFSR